jgi:hypothetical protein
MSIAGSRPLPATRYRSPNRRGERLLRINKRFTNVLACDSRGLEGVLLHLPRYELSDFKWSIIQPLLLNSQEAQHPQTTARC